MRFPKPARFEPDRCKMRALWGPSFQGELSYANAASSSLRAPIFSTPILFPPNSPY